MKVKIWKYERQKNIEIWEYEKKIKIIELSTGITNKKAQSLYESLEYKRDKEYYNYFLEL